MLLSTAYCSRFLQILSDVAKGDTRFVGEDGFIRSKSAGFVNVLPSAAEMAVSQQKRDRDTAAARRENVSRLRAAAARAAAAAAKTGFASGVCV
jgi:hypothetical protein